MTLFRQQRRNFEMSKDSSFYYFKGKRTTARPNYGTYNDYYGTYFIQRDTLIFYNLAYDRLERIESVSNKKPLVIQLAKKDYVFNLVEKGYYIDEKSFKFNGKLYTKSRKATRIYWSMMKDFFKEINKKQGSKASLKK